MDQGSEAMVVYVIFGVTAVAIIVVSVAVLTRLTLQLDRLINTLDEMRHDDREVAADLLDARGRADRTEGAEGAAADAASRSRLSEQ